MKLAICSDIHVHRRDQTADVQDLVTHINAQRNLDLLICAGDLSHHTDEVRVFLESITVDCLRAWLPGNHDLWVIDAESGADTADSRYRVTLPAMSLAAGWCYLPSGPLDLPGGGFAVVGTIGWFTDAGYSEWFDSDADERDQELARRFAEELEQSIRAAEKNARLIVVTHHVPHVACLPDGDPRQAEHSVHIAEVIARHADRISLVVHGHKHRRYGPVTIDGVRYIAHPFGYPRQHNSPEDGLRIIELND